MIQKVNKLFFFIASGFFLLMFFSAFNVYVVSSPLFSTRVIKFAFLLLIFLGAGLVLRSKKISSSFFLIALLVMSFALRLSYILIYEAEPVSDFALMHNTAVALNEGDLQALKIPYYDFAIFNASFTIYEMLVLKVVNSIMALKVMSVIFSTLIVLFIYKIARNIFNETAGRLAGLLACVFPPLIVYNEVLTNQTLCILFVLMGIYFLLVKRKFILAGIFMRIAQVFRPIGIIFIIGGLIYIVYECFFKKSGFTISGLKSFFFNFLKLILPYHFILITISVLLISLNLTEHTLYHNPTPSYKFLVGLNHQTKGRYSQADAKLLQEKKDNFEEIAQRKIKKRTQNIPQLIFLFEQKFKKMWGGTDASFFWADNQSTNQRQVSHYIWLLVLFLCFWASLFFIKNRPSNRILYIVIVLMGFVGLYFLIEIQTRYRYELYPLFIILAGFGGFFLMELFEKNFLKSNRKPLAQKN